jgi:hypothetical protein
VAGRHTAFPAHVGRPYELSIAEVTSAARADPVSGVVRAIPRRPSYNHHRPIGCMFSRNVPQNGPQLRIAGKGSA